MIREPNIDYNCELNIFIKDAFLKNKDTKCNLNELNSFAKVFLMGKVREPELMMFIASALIRIKLTQLVFVFFHPVKA